MRKINKRPEPISLTKHRAQLHADYDNYADKDDLRESLFIEQRGICCYCMGPIRDTALEMKVEHNRCQAKYPAEQLDYRNLLGACLGSQSQPEQNQHCDTFKGNKDLFINPANPLITILSTIHVSGDGRIYSDNAELDNELNSVLNLNATGLKAVRKSTLSAFTTRIEKDRGQLTRATLQKWLNDWDGASHTNNLRPYCGVIISWLQKKLNQA